MSMCRITDETVPRMSDACAVRKTNTGVLLHHAGTDEMHLIGPLGHTVVQLCDGLTTVRELLESVRPVAEGEEELEEKVRAFVGSMVQRRVLEIDND